jgi:hypothetical protein
VVSFKIRPLYPQGRSPYYTLDRRLGGSQSRSGRGVEEKNSQPPHFIINFYAYYNKQPVFHGPIRNKYWRTTDKRWSYSFGVGKRANNSSP